MVPSEGFPPSTPESGRRLIEDVAHRHALRLTFLFRDSRVELSLIESIEMVISPSMEITDQQPAAAFWYELRDGEQMPLYRWSQRNPFASEVEVPTGNPENPLQRVKSARTAGEFTLLVPDLPEARSVVLYEWMIPSDTKRDDVLPPPREIARFPLGEAIDKEVIARDTIPPRTVSDALAAYERVAVIHLRASDNTGEVAYTLYRLDDGEEQQDLTVTIDEPGEHTLQFWSVDRAGNVEPPNQVVFTIRPPTKRGRK